MLSATIKSIVLTVIMLNVVAPDKHTSLLRNLYFPNLMFYHAGASFKIIKVLHLTGYFLAVTSSLTYSRAPESYTTWVSSGLNRKHVECGSP
jgi:hypothetical protein